MLDLTKIPQAVRHEGGVSRRLFLVYAAALAAVPLLADRAEAKLGVRGVPADPFTLGVASGDPEPTGVVLWTRLAPQPLQPGGGMPPENYNVDWEVAEDDGMRKVVQSGTAVATPDLGHSVHVEVEGLRPDRWYWYRFRTGGADSPIGRTRTAPEVGATPDNLRFAFASCQHYEAGYFTAYDHMAKDDLDLIVHLGDYIYEGAGSKSASGPVRRHFGPEIGTLDQYRARHAQYRSDKMLQAAHARCPWVLTWDDHEVANNYANGIPGNDRDDPVTFMVRRANAYRAYYEAMPLRKTSLPRGADMQLYRTVSFGQLARFQVLDTRQYRTDQPNGDGRKDMVGGALDPNGTLLGKPQRAWLDDALAKSPATWNVLAQQVMMGMVDRAPGDKHAYPMDQWPGYVHERVDLIKCIGERKVKNPVVLTGDIHSNWVNDLRPDDRKQEQPVVATEFVGTSISSGGVGLAMPKDHATTMAENPGTRFYNAERGYVRCEVTPGAWRSDYVVVENVTRPGSKVFTRASFAVEAGRPGAVKA